MFLQFIQPLSVFPYDQLGGIFSTTFRDHLLHGNTAIGVLISPAALTQTSTVKFSFSQSPTFKTGLPTNKPQENEDEKF
jgi:hypothetical protein